MQAAIAADFAELAGRDHVASKRQHRIAQIVEANLGLDALRLGRLRHLARIACQRRQRLLAIDVLAGGNGGKRHFLMECIGRGDVHHIDVGIGHQRPPVGGGMRKAKCCGRIRRRRLGDVRETCEFQREGQVEHAGCRRIAEGVCLAHEAAADQAYAEARPGHLRSVLLTMRSGSMRPAKKSSTFCTEETAMRSAACRVSPAICGVSTT